MYYIRNNFITGHSTLRVLRLGGNILGDDGMKLIIEGFQDNNTLVDLGVWSCKLSAKGRLAVDVLNRCFLKYVEAQVFSQLYLNE